MDGIISIANLTLCSLLLFLDLNHWHSACQLLSAVYFHVVWARMLYYKLVCSSTQPCRDFHTTTSHFIATACCCLAASLYWLAEQFPSILQLLPALLLLGKQSENGL